MPVAGPDGPTGLPDCIGSGGWQHGIVDAWRPYGRPRSNTAARDRSAYKPRTPPGIAHCGKPAVGEPLLPEPPSAHAGGLLHVGNHILTAKMKGLILKAIHAAA